MGFSEGESVQPRTTMISFLLPYLAVFFTSFTAASFSSLGPVVALPQGSYAGNDTIPSQIFFGGIAYAQPPLGDLRWKTPLRVEDAKEGQGVKDASNWGPIWYVGKDEEELLHFGAKTVRAEPFPRCPSSSSLLPLVSIQQPAVVRIGSEDCLTLNVWKPAYADESSKLAVLVYIHVRPSAPPVNPRARPASWLLDTCRTGRWEVLWLCARLCNERFPAVPFCFFLHLRLTFSCL
jgi:hypothetical protein